MVKEKYNSKNKVIIKVKINRGVKIKINCIQFLR